MRALLEPVRAYLAELWALITGGWDRFWFAAVDPTALAFVRICTGAVLLYVHVACAPYFLTFIGPNGWIDARARADLQSPEALAREGEAIRGQPLQPEEWGMFRYVMPSVYDYVTDPFWMAAVHGLFLVAMACVMVGYQTRTAAALAWVGHLSFLNRGFIVWFGMDVVLGMLLLYLFVGDSGATWSFDRLARRYRGAREALQRRDGGGPAEAPIRSWTANLGLRLIQLHMCVIYFCAGCAKLQGARWWNGSAVWMTMMYPEYRLVDVSWLAAVPLLPDLVSCLGVAGTIGFEIGFPFLVWNRMLRPLMLGAGVVLHLGIWIFMGLGGFGAAMLTGLSSFFPSEGLRWLAGQLLAGPGGYRYVLDRASPGQVEFASLVKAVDFWNQVEVIDAAASPAAAGTLLAPDGAALSGWAAAGRLLRALRLFVIVAPLAAFSGAGAERAAPVGARGS